MNFSDNSCGFVWIRLVDVAGEGGEWVYYREAILLLADHFIVTKKRRNRGICCRKKVA